MATKPVARIGVSFQLKSGRTVCLNEGDIICGLTYKDGNDIKTINGSVRVLNANTKAIGNKTSCPPEPYISELLNVTSIIVDSSTEFDAELTQVSIASIIEIDEIKTNDGAILVGGNDQVTLTQAINNAPAGSTIELLNGRYEEDLVITKSIKITSKSGAIINGAITIAGETTDPANEATFTDVELEGLYLSGKSAITLNNTNTFNMQNCIFKEHDFETARTIPIKINVSDKTPIKINMDNNTFGAENKNCYNIVEVYGELKDGSTFNNNQFDKDSCTHNHINIYRVEDDAVIEINNNYCVESKNMVRIGTIGDAKCTIEMNNNKYDETDELYPGLFLVQPFGNQTINMGNVVLRVNNTTKPAGIIGYFYAGADDTQLTTEQRPKLYIDDVLTELTDLS